jgi:hypothetical protein
LEEERVILWNTRYLERAVSALRQVETVPDALLASGLAALLGYLAFDGVAPAWVAAVNAVAAGAILAMIADTMIPEAFETAHEYAGLITIAGFLAAFALSKLGGG